MKQGTCPVSDLANLQSGGFIVWRWLALSVSWRDTASKIMREAFRARLCENRPRGVEKDQTFCGHLKPRCWNCLPQKKPRCVGMVNGVSFVLLGHRAVDHPYSGRRALVWRRLRRESGKLWDTHVNG